MRPGITLRTELVQNWKTLLVYLLIIQLMVAGLIMAFPSMEMMLNLDPEGAENISIETVEGVDTQTVLISWEPVEGASNYTVLVNDVPQMIAPERVEGIASTEYERNISLEDGEVPLRYFSVVAVMTGGEQVFIGMQTNTEPGNVWSSFYWEDMSDINGVISLFWDMWWVLLIGVFLVYMTVNMVNWDIEEGRLDILLSTLLTRRRYVLEKFLFLTIYTTVLLTVTLAMMILSLAAIGELGQVSLSGLGMSVFLSLPLFLTITALSLLLAVGLGRPRGTMGLAILVLMIQYGLYLFGNMAESLSYLKMLSPLNYWDHRTMLYEHVFSVGDLTVLVVVTAVALVAAVAAIERRDLTG